MLFLVFSCRARSAEDQSPRSCPGARRNTQGAKTPRRRESPRAPTPSMPPGRRAPQGPRGRDRWRPWAASQPFFFPPAAQREAARRAEGTSRRPTRRYRRRTDAAARSHFGLRAAGPRVRVPPLGSHLPFRACRAVGAGGRGWVTPRTLARGPPHPLPGIKPAQAQRRCLSGRTPRRPPHN